MATGGVTGSDLIDQVLLCQICLNALVSRKARQLSCLHTFCESCLENILKRTPGTKINCSTCRQTTELPGGRVANLPLNFNIEQAHQMAEEMAKTPFCTKCVKKKEFVRAKNRCITCNWQMCDPCKNQHNLFPGFSSHGIESINTGQVEAMLRKCKLHKTPVTLFCSTCKHLLCTECLMEGTHDSHPDNIKNTDLACKENRQLVSKKKSVLIKPQDNLGANNPETLKIKEHFKRVKKDIVEFADTLKSQIDENVEDLMRTLEQNHIAKLDNRKVSLDEALKKISLFLRNVEEFETKENTVFLEKSESWIQDVTKFEQIIQDLKEGNTVQLVTFSKRLQISVIGNFDKIDHLPSASHDTEPLTGDDLNRLSRDMKVRQSATTKPTLVNKHVDLPISQSCNIATMNDGTAVFVAMSRDGLMRININGEIVSRYKHGQPISITSVSTFGGRIIFTDVKIDNINELALDGQRMILVKTHKKHGIKAHGVCLDHGGHVILFGEKTVAKLDHGGNIMWQKNVDKPCSGVLPVSLDRKECYLVNSESTRETEIWNEHGQVIGSFQYPPSECGRRIKHTSVTPTGSFIVTHDCQFVYSISPPPDNDTVSEYAPDGSFIRHLLTRKDGIEWPSLISCDQQGYMWVIDIGYTQYPLTIYKL